MGVLIWKKWGKGVRADNYYLTRCKIPEGWKYTLRCWGVGTLGHSRNDPAALKRMAQEHSDNE